MILIHKEPILNTSITTTVTQTITLFNSYPIKAAGIKIRAFSNMPFCLSRTMKKARKNVLITKKLACSSSKDKNNQEANTKFNEEVEKVKRMDQSLTGTQVIHLKKSKKTRVLQFWQPQIHRTPTLRSYWVKIRLAKIRLMTLRYRLSCAISRNLNRLKPPIILWKVSDVIQRGDLSKLRKSNMTLEKIQPWNPASTSPAHQHMSKHFLKLKKYYWPKTFQMELGNKQITKRLNFRRK